MEEHKRLIANIVDNRLFNSLFEEMRREVAEEIIEGTEPTDIPGLVADAHALKRLQQKLVEIANQVRMGT